MKIILASSSPRRRELLNNMGVEFECIIPTKDEDMSQKMSIEKLSEKLSLQKAQEVFDNTTGDRIVIGSDCMVYYKNKKIGKAQSRDEAYKTLSMLSGKSHKVVTGLCVMVQNKDKTRLYLTHDTSKVKFNKLSKSAINAYLDTNEYVGKAGSYAIQGKFAMHIQKINGNYSTIVGLPTHKLYEILKIENVLK